MIYHSSITRKKAEHFEECSAIKLIYLEIETVFQSTGSISPTKTSPIKTTASPHPGTLPSASHHACKAEALSLEQAGHTKRHKTRSLSEGTTRRLHSNSANPRSPQPAPDPRSNILSSPVWKFARLSRISEARSQTHTATDQAQSNGNLTSTSRVQPLGLLIHQPKNPQSPCNQPLSCNEYQKSCQRVKIFRYRYSECKLSPALIYCLANLLGT